MFARYAGTSAEMISRTYGHLAAGAEELARQRLHASIISSGYRNILRRKGNDALAGSKWMVWA
jgi:hypothetical protein